MIERFQGDEGNRRLRETLANQSLIHGDTDLAARVADVGELLNFETGATLIENSASDNEIYLLLTGTVEIVVNERVVAVRRAGSHVGEMALIDPSAPRCAKVVVTERVVACRIDERTFSALATDHPALWRRVALQLSDRLRQRNALVIPPNQRPHLFIGSSVESLPVARAIQLGLEHDNVTVKIWTDGVFGASSFTIEALEAEVRSSDFGLMVFGPDDKILSREDAWDAPRDNVIFELGMCMGALTHVRTFFVYPRDHELKIPTDLLGLTPLTYSLGQDGDYDAALGVVCERIRRAISDRNVK